MCLFYSLVPAFALLFVPHAIAQTAYPDRPIKMIVPLAAASAVDVAARVMFEPVSLVATVE
jgi:tripartite-type tricarboxylate transporter receptor subunit TctC